MLVPYDAEARALLAGLVRGDDTDYALLRRAQRYLVEVPDRFRDHCAPSR